MKATSFVNKSFSPISVTLQFETQDELELLYNISTVTQLITVAEGGSGPSVKFLNGLISTIRNAIN